MQSRTSKKRRLVIYGWFVCSLAAFFYCYEYILRIEPSIMLPTLARYFDVSTAGLSILVATYYFAYTPLQAVVGIIVDYFGVRKIVISAISVCVLGSLLFVITQNIFVAALGRLFIGLGSAFAFVSVLKLAAVWLPKKHFAVFVGIAVALGMLGGLIGDILLTHLLSVVSWYYLLIYIAMFGAILIPLFVLFVREKKTVFAKGYREKVSWSATFKTLWILIGKREIVFTGIIGCLLFLSLSVVAGVWGVHFIHVAVGLTKTGAAEVNSMIFLGWLIGGPVNGWISDIIKSRRLPLLWGSLLAALMMGIVLLIPDMNIIVLGLLLFLFGLFSSTQVLVFVIAREIVSLKFVATSLALVNFFTMLGGVILQPLVGILINWLQHDAVGDKGLSYASTDYRIALTIVPIAMLISAVLAFFLRETYGKPVQIK